MLKWTEGDYWVSDQPLVTSSAYFFYKYCVINNDEIKHQESGIDRICQPELLPTGTHGVKVDPSSGGRNVHIQDEWESYTANLQIYDPCFVSGEQLSVQIFD